MVEAIGRRVEGRLDIAWVNCNAPQSTPRYDLIFMRYANFKSGAQKPNSIVGTDALETYLIKVGFDAGDARDWIRKINENNIVSIPNILMPEQHLADYGL